jgi:F-type H+-transporting ATPase subunit delta
MQPASRAALAAARDKLESRIGSTGGADLDRLGEDLGAVAAVLDEQPVIRRHLADPAVHQQARRKLVEALFAGKLSPLSLEVLADVVASRWSQPRDLIDGVEELARQALLALAERDDSLDDVEDELFRFGRILVAQPQLAALLGDATAPATRRVELLETVLAGRTRPVTSRLLEQAVRSPRGRPLAEIVEQLVDRAAARRQQSVGYVTAASPVNAEQEQRLTDALKAIYRRPISLKIEVDPAVLGGLVIRVGDEVIDGSVAARLDQARQWMTGGMAR